MTLKSSERDSSSGEKTGPRRSKRGDSDQLGDPESWHSDTLDSDFSDGSQVHSLPYKNLGDFELIREIGQGGMGIVYEARQRSLDKRVALKVLPFASVLDQRVVKRFKNEAWAAAQLQHRNIVPVYHVGNDRGVHYFAMQYVEGGDLADLYLALQEAASHGSTDKEIHANVRTQAKNDPNKGTLAGHPTKLSPSDAPDGTVQATSVESVVAHKSGWSKGHTLASRKLLDLVAKKGATSIPDFIGAFVTMGIQVADALHHAHEIGIVHRDIKPSNLLLDVDGEVWIADFGLAQVQGDPGMTATGAIVGTLRYVSPEQAMGKRVGVDHRTDIYSLGITLYELLTLTRAFSGDSRESILHKIAFEEPLAPRKIDRRIPEELETIVMKAISKNPSDRYQTAAEMADDLRLFRDNQPIKGRKPTVLQRTTRWARRHRSVVASAAGILAASFVASIVIALILWNYYAATAVALETEQEQKAKVERLLQRSEGLRLATNATIETKADPTRALLLSIEASKRYPGAESNDATLQALNAMHEYKTLSGHSAAVGHVSFNPDGTRVVSCSAQDRFDRGSDPALIWDTATGDLLGKLRPTESSATSITSCIYYPDGGRILATSSPGRRYSTDDLNGNFAGPAPAIWDELTYRRLKTFKDAFLFETHPAIFDDRGDRVVLPAIGNTARIYDSRDAKELRSFIGHEKRVVFAAFSPDGRRVATASDDNTVRIWDADNADQEFEFTIWRDRAPKAERCLVKSIMFRHDSRQLLTASQTFGTHLWDLASGQRVNKENYPGDIAEYLPGGLTFTSRHELGSEKLEIRNSRLGVSTGLILSHNGPIGKTAVSSDARWLAANDYEEASLVSIWNIPRRDAVATLRGHTAIVNHIAFNSKSNLIATASSDKTVRLWHVRNGAQRSTYDATVPIANPVFAASPDGQNLAVATTQWFDSGRVVDFANGNVGPDITGKQWMPESAASRFVTWTQDTVSVRTIADQTTHASTTIFGSSIRTARINHDGDRVAVLADRNAVTLWLLDEERKISLLGSTKANLIAFDRAGSQLASAHTDGTVHTWNADTGEQIAAMSNDGDIADLSYSQDGTKLLVCTSQNRAVIWDTVTAEQRTVLRSNDAVFNQAKFNFDGSAAISYQASESKSVQLWDTLTGKLLDTVEAIGLVHVALHPTKTEALIGSSESGVILWNIDENTKSTFTDQSVISCGYSVDGSQFCLCTPPSRQAAPAQVDQPFVKRSAIEIWDRDSIKRLRRTEIPNGQIQNMYVANSDQLLVQLVDRNAVVNFDVQTHQPRAIMRGHAAPVTAAIFDSNSSHLVTVSKDHCGYVWDAQSGDLISRLSGHTSPITSLGLSTDNDILVTGDQTGQCSQWDLASGQLIATNKILQAAIKYLAITSDGERMIAVGADTTISLWNLVDQKPIQLDLESDQVVWSEFDSEGQRLLAVFASPLDADAQAELPLPPSHKVAILSRDGVSLETIRCGAPVSASHFHPDGRHIITATTTGSISLHDITNGDQLRSIKSNVGRLYTIASDATGEFVAAIGTRNIVVWKLSDGTSWLTVPHLQVARASHNFSPFVAGKNPRIISYQQDVRRLRDWPLIPATSANAQAPRDLTATERARFYVPDNQ